MELAGIADYLGINTTTFLFCDFQQTQQTDGPLRDRSSSPMRNAVDLLELAGLWLADGRIP
jgi:hypothetical protein